MKRFFCIFLSFLLVCGALAGCGKAQPQEAAEPSHILEGKRVIFIGNSHTYKGGVVNYIGSSTVEQEPRNNDLGLFYLLCLENGANVSVTNWTFSGHGLQNLFGRPCQMSSACGGKNHEEYLTDRYYDYVVVTPGVGTASAQLLPEDMAYIKDFFLEANPNAVFVCLGNASVYGHNAESTPYPGITGYYKTLEQEGWLIADWGRIVSDLINGQATPEGSGETFYKNTFIVKDGFHPNLLSGYIATVMTYCTITGESAQSLAPDFFTSKSIFNATIEQQLSGSYARGEQDTNFHKILMSETEMAALLALIDQQLKTRPYLQNEMPQ